MQQLVEEAISALTHLDAEQLDRLRGELASLQRTPPSPQQARAAQPSLDVLALLLQMTERNLRLLRRTTLCDDARDAEKFSIYPAARPLPDAGR